MTVSLAETTRQTRNSYDEFDTDRISCSSEPDPVHRRLSVDKLSAIFSALRSFCLRTCEPQHIADDDVVKETTSGNSCVCKI